MKQERVWSNPEGGGATSTGRRQTGWSNSPKGELVGASGPARPFEELDDGCFSVRDPLSEALSNISRLIVWILCGIVTNLILGFLTSPFFWILSVFYKEDIWREVSDFDFVVTDFDPNTKKM